MTKTINIKYVGWSMAIVLVLGIIGFAPNTARADSFGIDRILDPLCLFTCSNEPDVRVTNNYNSNNVNSNINSNVVTTTNSPGTTVNASTVTTNAGFTYDSGYGYSSSGYGYGGSVPTVVNNPVVQTPTYAYTNSNPSYSYNTPLRVSCSANDTSVNSGDSVRWRAEAYGGNGNYNYSWSGDEGLSGYGQSISKTYYNRGYKNASVTVTSGSQVASANCGNSVYVEEDYYDPGYPSYNLYVSCVSNTANSYVNGPVTWSAYVSGGNGGYRYTWSGTDNLRGSDQSVTKYYSDSGTKTARVTVRSDGQSVTATCSNSVYVSGYSGGTYYPSYYQNYPSYYQSNNSGLDIGCYSDPTNAKVNQPVNWVVEVLGGVGPYTYSWTGTDGLTGTQSSVVKYYSTAGSKSAIVTVTSADGRTASRACANTLTVGSAYKAPVKPATPVVTPVTPTTSPLQAAALFSLSNVPWGWVAFLVILILFATVLYLMFNRTKI